MMVHGVGRGLEAWDGTTRLAVLFNYFFILIGTSDRLFVNSDAEVARHLH